MKQRLNFLIFSGIFAVIVCAQPATYRVDISPRQDDIYEMELNKTVTFYAKGYGKKPDAAIETEVNIDKLWWDFDKAILEKSGSDSRSITLKAIKEGASTFTCMAMVKNADCSRSITIMVGKNK